MSIDVVALKASVDLASIVGAYLPLKKKGQEFLGLCPFHADTNPSFYVIPNKGLCHCFACGWSGDVLDFLMEQEGIDFKSACERLGANNWPKAAPRITVDAKPERITSKPPADAPVPNMATRELGEPSHTWTYRDTDGGILGYVTRYETQEGKQIRCWTWGARGQTAPTWGCGHWNSPRPLYGLFQLAKRQGDPVVVVEGEKSAESAAKLLPSYIASTWSGGANAWSKADWTSLNGRTVLIWPDADEPGWDVGEKIAAQLATLGCKVRVVNTAGQPKGWDLADAEAEGWDTERVIAWAKPRAKDYIPLTVPNPAPQADVGARADPAHPPSAAASPADAGPPEMDLPPLEAYNERPSLENDAVATKPLVAGSVGSLVYINAASVIPRAVRWLWKGRIPRGKVSIIAGDPGLGKSQVCASLASVVTNGGLWPVDRTPCEQGSVVILSAEDDPEDTIRPRLEAAGADVSRVTILQAVRYQNDDAVTAERGFNLGEDMAKLRDLLMALEDVRLVVIDPVSAYLGTLDSHKNAEVRAMLMPLSSLAAVTDCSILLVSHLTKGQAGSVLARIQGSMAFGAAARAVWGVTKDHDNAQRRLFMPMKNNLGRDDTGLAYSIESYRLEAPEDDEPIETSRIMWEPEQVTISPEDAFSSHVSDEGRSAITEAKEFLRDALLQGPMQVSEIQKLSRIAGHVWITIKRAQSALKIKAEKTGFGGGWSWKLP